jgi:diacylglycerol kinase (ATP)
MVLEQPFVNKKNPSRQNGPGDSAARREMTVCMVTNPRSGGNRRGLGEVRKFMARNPSIHHRETTTPAELNDAMADFSARECDLLVVNGGDGTLQAVLTGLYGRSIFPRPPVLAPLQAGTTSMLARDVGMRGPPMAALAKIRAWSIDPGRSADLIHDRPVLKVRQEAETNPVCGMFFGAGAIVRGIALCHGSMNPNGLRGELMPGLILARLVLSVLTGKGSPPKIHMGISLDDGRAWQDAYLVAMASTLERLFLGLHPFWGGEAAPLHFTAVKANASYLPRNIPFLLRGRRTASASPENGYLSHNARKMTFDFRGRFTLDGELFEARAPLVIEPAGPARFLRA